jgi:hypothetical protein
VDAGPPFNLTNPFAAISLLTKKNVAATLLVGGFDIGMMVPVTSTCE